MSAILMLRHIQEAQAADRIETALNDVLESRQCITRDLGGSATTREFTEAIIQRL